MVRFEWNDEKTDDSFKPLIINGLAKRLKNALFRKEIRVDEFRANLRAGKLAFFLTLRHLQPQVSYTCLGTKLMSQRPVSLDSADKFVTEQKNVPDLNNEFIEFSE